ncbi:hypothetical protein SGGMMB4_02886 [Sodalis glossinidius str. 'morsitans']|uniref:Uncharacterized protein n=1 Tax=Sodalis glossinidius (strain morsitans) TaxID=343509 RepID=A0A193QJB7_SODGM|nr:hypothetical protein SGGMMB4_02886 [Sodalis glossinidius str. 'morsitans']
MAANLHEAQCRIGELANDNSDLRARLASYPADWQEDSSLMIWFPLTANELFNLRAKYYEFELENEDLRARLSE